MNNKYYHITIALAGACQSAQLIPQLANTGTCSTSLYQQTIKTIFMMSPNTTADVYGGVDHIQTGLQALLQVLSSKQKEHIEIIRYLFGSLGVTSKLLKNSDALTKIDQRLTRISGIYADKMDDDTIATHLDDLSYSLAGIYSDIISPLSSKIKVMGKIEYLQNSLVQAKVRTTLLGCVRSAILWYQVGGSRLQLLFARKSIYRAAQNLLHEINNGVN
ncbi:high frequency lysogenization protein HflD [Orbaceae bacterium ESL0727]|nr:high frequency lysogenization protein HflD [Orbaceae bacterium ESL0727]